MSFCRVAVSLCALACAALALGDVIAIPAAHDNTMYDGLDNNSNGAGQHLFAGTNGEGDARRGLISFDVAGAVPPGATITGATLTLHMSRSLAGAEDVSLYRALASWGEGSSVGTGEEGTGAPAQPGDATWHYRFYSTQMWNTDGGDFTSTLTATTSVAGDGFYSWSSAQLLADVQDMFTNPAANFGWVLKGVEGVATTTKRFDTRENTTADFRPVLTVTFVPEPAALAAVGLALAAGRRR